MWLLAFALVLQVVVILELVLNRIIAVLCNARRNPMRKLADGSFCGSLLALVMSVLTIPVSMGAAAAQLFLSYITLWVSLLLVIAVLAVLSETSSALIVLYVNAYNSGIGQVLNEILVLLFEIFAPFWRAVVPVYNALVYVIVGFWVDVLLPIIFLNANLLPDLIINFTVLMGSVATATYEWFVRLSMCTETDVHTDNATSPFWVNDMSCVGNPHFLTLDLMTPALYAQRSATTLQQILTTSCVPVTNAMTLVLYPLLDVNMYKAIHGLVNAVLHLLIALPLATQNRCSYAHGTTDYVYTAVEKQVMCTPDVSALTAILVSTFKSIGALIDNWLDTVLVVTENSVTGVMRSCATTPLPLVWQNATDVLGTSEIRVVGLTPSMYAITDADSVVYHSMVGANLRVAYALHAWPFKIDLRFGVAAVSYGAVPDLDDEGDARTGLFGCRCVDSVDTGLQVMCASVPFQNHLAEDENQQLEYTVHRMRFVPDSARLGLTCSQVTIRVVPLRFSRRRFSAPGAGRVEFGFGDEFNTRLQYGARAPAGHTVDAAVILTPKCAVHASVLCVPSIENCFPFCMGLHAAGQRSQNISLINAQRWDEWTSLGQTDCVVGAAVARQCDVMQDSRLLLNDEVGVEISGCAATACAPDTASVTFIKNSEQEISNRSLSVWTQEQPWGFARSALQPFVAAGDVFLYRSATDAVSGQILVTRLYDNKRGDFSLQQEKLSLVTNSVPMQYYQCMDELCYAEQLRENRVVLPVDYFVGVDPTVAAASEWGVHWTATPSSAKCALVVDFCTATSRDEVLIYKAHRARLWTVRTMRHTQSLGMAFTEEALSSYMVIPDWFSCSIDDFLEETQCKRMYNMKVTGLEYINADNLLLTVLAATPGDWDWRSENVIDGRPFQYRFYFVHPNRHDCTNDNDEQTMYTCWRSAEDGMFSAPSTSVSETGALCPMLQRMPKWGSMVTEVLVSQVYLGRVLLDALFVMPLVVHGDVSDIFEQHPRPTFHSLLDASGTTLFELEDTLQAMQMSAFHAANTIARAGALMQTLGAQELETVLVGTARVFQLTKAASMVEDQVFGQSVQAVSGPFNRLVSMFASSSTESAPMPTPGTPASLSTQASSKWITVFKSIAGPSVSWSRITVKLMRKVLIKIILKVRVLALRDMASSLVTSMYESENEMSRGLFDNMKSICDASGQVVGRTNSWGQSVRHSCMLVPESIQSIIHVILILTIDYQVMDCVCKQTDGFVVQDVLNNVCLPRIMPMARKAFVMDSIALRSTSACFTVMDAVNDKLLHVFDPVFSRMVKAQLALESAFGLLVTQAMGMDSLNMKCMQYDSPYVVSIMPEPVDYFMGCMETFDCRARCLDTMQSFDEAKTTYSSYSSIPLAYINTSDIDTESRYFSYADMELGKHLAPFAVYAVVQLPDSACVNVCPTQQARCVAVAGLKLGALAVAYYCVPASLVMSVYEGIQPESEQKRYNDAVHTTRSVLDIQFVTVHKHDVGGSEWLMLLVRDTRLRESSVWILPSGIAGAAWQIVQTREYNPVSTLATLDTRDPAWLAETISFVRVLPAHGERVMATVFVLGSTRSDDAETQSTFCFYVLVDTNLESSDVDLTRHACHSAPGTVQSETHATVCLGYDCSQVVRIGLAGDSDVRLETLNGYNLDGGFDWTVNSTRDFTMPKNQRKLLDIDRPAILSTSQDRTLQFTRRTLSLFGSITRGSFAGKQLSIDVPLTGRGQLRETWLQNVRLKMDVVNVDMKVTASFTTAQRLEMVVNCTVTTCVGCHGTHPLQVDLQNKCFAAASCGIAKCVGTPVNMKRPMCQIASLLGLQIAFVRVNIQSFWDFFSRSIITIVELSQSRRELYEITTPQETTMATVCSAKDGIIESIAIFGALYAQIPAHTLDSASQEPLSLQEIRYNTERVMIATAVVEFLSQIGLGAVYVPLVSSKVMQCQLNDAFLVIEGIATTIAQASTKADIVKFRMGSQKFDQINDYAIGMCLTDKFKQDMRDIADPVREQSISSGLQDIFDGITGLVTTQKYGILAMGLDGIFSWILGILSGTMNLMQVVDSDNCRLPATNALVIGSCVCGDTPARIPNKQRSSKRVDALWCRGPLMMTNVLGNDILVWNAFSLTELLTNNKVQEYFDCLVQWPGDPEMCVVKRPVNSFFEAQGVDVLQIIIRCRSNYQQKRWDEGALVLGLLERAEDWQPHLVSTVSLTQMYEQAGSSFSTLRKRLAQISLSIDGVADLDDSTWSCLREALFANRWNHNCAELALSNGIFEDADSLMTYFEYDTYSHNNVLRTDAALFHNADACESFSGSLKSRSSKGVSYPKMAWDGDSQNTVPVAELHNKLQGDSKTRILQAKVELDTLIRTKIEPAFAAFTEETLHEIETEFWSLEGDSLHQAVDCVMLGPYAAADMLPIHKTLQDTFPTPQYHRGNPDSREISYGIRTQGSPARQKIMGAVIQHVSNSTDEKLRKLVLSVIETLRRAYTSRSNLYCTCIGSAAPSIECCISNEAMHAELAQFGTTFSAQSVLPMMQNMHEAFTASTVNEGTQTKILEEIWYDEASAIDVVLSEPERRVLADLYAFDYGEPVREYSANEVSKRMNLTLWSYCVHSLEGVFFTMPLRVEFDGSAKVDADTHFDPHTSTETDANKYLHGMERAIEDILAKARLHSPTFWSHVHRYMPSDSVWCEDTHMRRMPPKRNATYPDEWNELQFDTERVAAANADEVLYVSRLGSTCACGLSAINGSCSVPPGLCARVADNSSRLWQICDAGVYSTRNDVFLVRLAMHSHPDLTANCDETQPSTVWGLLDSTQRYKWYNGSSERQHVDLHEVAAHGPAGVRLAMLLQAQDVQDTPMSIPRGPPVNLQDAFNEQFDHTVAQPVCRSSQHMLFTEDLGEYFRDVLFPMAHAVHEAPNQVICGRWVVEYALYVAILNISGATSSATGEQRLIEERWRTRCMYHLGVVGICNLRNVYGLVPPNKQSTSHCKFSLTHNACQRFYVTDSCLLMCDGQLYDPCLCDNATACTVAFNKTTCVAGRRYKPQPLEHDMDSLHWPRTVWPANNAQQQTLDSFLRSSADPRLTLHENLVVLLRKQAAREEGVVPVSFCDDLLDYIDPHAQHPVGYHPTCACDRAETNMRGFDSWMSTTRDSDNGYNIDPVRMRNMSMYSTTFGAAHLTCDAAAYGSSGAQLNTLRMQSKWNSNARADPAMPVFADISSEGSMADVAEPSSDHLDTPLQAAAESDAIFRHSVGLVRDWMRDYDDVSQQDALDERWPHWLDTPSARSETFSSPSGEDLHGGCAMPALLRCYEDVDCSSQDASLRCRNNYFNGVLGDAYGICVKLDTCYQHAHCGDDKLCSGSGFCEEPEIIVHNSLLNPIDVRIHAKDSTRCTGNAYGTSAFQRVPTFGRDNGLCSVHNLFNYRNLTHDVSAHDARPSIKSVDAHSAMFIPDAFSWLSIADSASSDARNAMKMEVDPCDRDYEHTDYAICTPQSTDSSPTFASTRTWREEGANIKIDFCNLQVGSGVFDTLTSPYMNYNDHGYSTDSLSSTETTIKQCNKFTFCPASVYTIHGKNVERLFVDTASGTDAVLAKYPTSFAGKCMSFGIWDGIQCRVDTLIVPLMGVLFGGATDVLALAAPFETLRDECPDAFGEEYSDAFSRFQSTYSLLSQPYQPRNELLRYDSASCDRMTDKSIQCVADTINRLILEIFDLQPQERGIEDLRQYMSRSRCTTHIYTQLERVYAENVKFMDASDVLPESIPGTSFYMFSGHFPVEVSLLWFWKCVLIANPSEGGTQVDWFNTITNPEAIDELTCENIMVDTVQDVTLRVHLQKQSDIYYSNEDRTNTANVFADILEIMRVTIDLWDVTSIPTLVCKVRHQEQLSTQCQDVLQYNNGDRDCWNRLADANVNTLAYHQVALTSCKDSDSKCTLFDVMFHFLFGLSSKRLRENTVLTVDWMVEAQIALRIRLETRLSPTFSYIDMIPEIEFKELYDLNQSLINNPQRSVFVVDDRAPTCTDRVVDGVLQATQRLQYAEYAIPKRIVETIPTGAAEGEFRIYRRILAFEEMRLAQQQQKEEVYQHYYIAGEDGNNHVAISQKQMLLLALYRVREIMYLGVAARFGTMRYLPEIRSLMQRDRTMSRDLSVRLGRTRLYDNIVKLQDFKCPEGKTISDASTSDLQLQLVECLKHLKVDIGWRVSKDKTVVTRADRDMLVNAFYVSFSTQPGTTFLDKLINTDWHTQHVAQTASLCFSTPAGAAPLLPLWTGMLDLQSCPHGKSCGCQLSASEQSTFVDLTCDKSAEIDSCARDFPVFYENARRAMYDKCWHMQGDFMGVAQYEQMKDGGLCSMKPVHTQRCDLEFGAHGRVKGSVASDLHGRTTVRRRQAGLFAATSTLFRRNGNVDLSEVTALQLLDTDIGGHSMRFAARYVGSRSSRSAVLDLTCVSAGKSCSQTEFSNWLSTIESSWAAQHNAHTVRQHLENNTVPASGRVHWHCPLQWLSAYSDRTVPYAARSPSAERNRIRFRHITGVHEYAHATVAETTRVAQHPARFLSDRSACVDALLVDGAVRFRCNGRFMLVDALDMHRGRWGPARFLQGSTPNCKSMLDWPHLYSRTVDGDPREKPDTSFYCNIFWRLPSFALRYVARTAMEVPDKIDTARASGSVCHMGRLSKLSPQKTDTVQFCTKYDTHSRCRMLRRNTTGEHTWYDHDFAFETPFAASRRPALRQRKCSTCDRHDTASFVDRRTVATPLSNNTAQLSVGQPTTVSVERVLAAALRRHVCPGGPRVSCPAIHTLFNESTWRQGRFLDALLSLATAHQQHNTPAPISDEALWAAPWVLCERMQNVTQCRGSIPKHVWQNASARVGACVRETSAAASRGQSSMDFCALSPQTATLCSQVVEWNNDITHVLCTAGNNARCTSRAFYYNPSQYSISNKDFVYNSVASMYMKLNSTACPVESTSQRESNQQKRDQCSSTLLEPVVAIVKLVRLVLRKLVMVVYYAIQIVFAILGLIVSKLADAGGATAEYFTDSLDRFVHLLLTTISQALDQIMQIMWVLFDFGDFNLIKEISYWVCKYVQFVIMPMIQGIIVPTIAIIIAFLEGIDNVLCKIGWCDTIQLDSWRDVHKSLSEYEHTCEETNVRELTEQADTLPAATRCWATYNTYYGDSGRLSCSAADTCRRGITDFSLVMCGACASFDDYMPFGCFDVTKTCTCNLPLLVEQGCTSNEECSLPDATCRFIDSDLEPSIGFTQCASCQTKRVCLVTSGRSDGFCACGLMDIELQRCVTQAQPVMTAYDKLCIYTQDYSFLRTTNYVFSFYTSMTAPCNQLNPSSTFCARESSDDQLYAVGVDAVRRRHLLSAEGPDSEMAPTDTQNSLCRDALSSDFMPAQRSACRNAYEYSTATLLELDLPWNLPPCTFCSVEDVVHNLFLQPQNLLMLVSNLSRVTRVVMRHSPLRVLSESARRMQKHISTTVQIAAVEPALWVEHANSTWHVHVLVDNVNVAMLADVLKLVLYYVPPPKQDGSSNTGRRLLTVEDVAEAVQQNFRVSAALRQAFATQLASSLDYAFESPASRKEWMTAWPPKVGSAVLQGDLCPPLTNMLRTTRRALSTVDVAYSMKKQAVPADSVQQAWINISRRGDVNVSWTDYGAVRASHDPLTATALVAINWCMAIVNLSPNYIFDVFAAAADELWDFVKCDYEAVQTCSKWRVHVLVASLVVVIYYVGVYIVCAAIGLSMPVLLAAVVIPSIVLYISYGYAPLCFPAIPICLYDDLVYSIQQLVPKHIRLPAVLYKSEQCASAAALRVDANCLRTCTDEPFSYLEWYDVLSWCLLEVRLDGRLVELVRQPFVAVVMSQQRQDEILEAVAFHARVYDTSDAELITTNRLCALVSAYKLIPYVALLFVAVMLVLGAVQALMLTVNVCFQVTFALFVSTFY
jgi:hypothetical protein